MNHTRHVPLLVFSLVSIFLCISCSRDCIALLSECELTPDPGPCKAAIPKYYFDLESKECKTFTWGGCGGTVPFESLEECQQCECFARNKAK